MQLYKGSTVCRFPIIHTFFISIATKQVPESTLLRDILYIIQGIDGKIIKFHDNKDGVVIDPQVRLGKHCGLYHWATYKFLNLQADISLPPRMALMKLAELGWLYSKIHKYCEYQANNISLGLIGQVVIFLE